jgi:hypothetical protein
MLRRVAHVRTEVSDERIATIIRVRRIGELGTMVAVINNWSTLLIPPKRQFLQELCGITSQKMALFCFQYIRGIIY